MINILWVEDNFSEQKKVEWFKERNVVEKTNFLDAKKAINTSLDKFDVVVLDINLENTDHTDEITDLAKHFKITEKEFLEESGMNLFLNLLEKGFPKEQIIFLTANADDNISRVKELRKAFTQEDDESFNSIIAEIGLGLDTEQTKQCEEFISGENLENLVEYLERYCSDLIEDETKNTYNRFCEAYKRCRIEPPEAINKNLNGAKHSLNIWLEKHEKNSYLVLRRGVIEGCKHLKLNTPSLVFNQYIKNSENHFNTDEMSDYLDVLENFLPLREPDNKPSFYKLFVRTLAHEWEESARPSKLDDRQETLAFSWIMKMTRNWIAHNSKEIFTNLTEQDVAYLFICNMRAMFALGDKGQTYENNLLSLFDTENNDEVADKITSKNIPLISTYVSYFNENTKRTDVHNILHDLQNEKDKMKYKGDEFFITGLYHCFWFLTSKCYNKKDEAKENRKHTNQAFISRNYTIKPYNYKGSEFLFTLARHIYKRSFES